MQNFSRLTRMVSVGVGVIILALGVFGCSDEEKTEVLEEELYVLNERSNTLTIFTAPGLERHGADIPMASPAPHHLHFDHAHIYYYVVGRTQGGLVHKYDGETNQLLATSTLAHYYTGISTTPDAQHVLVTDFSQGPADQRTYMYKLHAQDLAAVDSITCGSRPHYIAMSEDGNTVLVANAGSDEITLYYPNQEGEVINVKIDPNPDSAAQLGQPIFEPYCIALADNDSLAYVCCRKSKVADKATIFVFDVPRHVTIDTLYLPYVNRSGASTNFRLGLCELVDGDRYLAVTSQDGNSLFLVDLSDGSYEEAVVQEHVTFGVTATSDDRYLYITASNSGTQDPGWVYEIRRDGGSLTVTDSIEVGMLPNGIHVKPGGHTHEH